MSPFRLQGNYADESARKETLGHAAQCVIGSYAQGSASGHGPLRDRRALHHHRPYLLDGPRQGADCGTATGRRGHVRQVLADQGVDWPYTLAARTPSGGCTSLPGCTIASLSGERKAPWLLVSISAVPAVAAAATSSDSVPLLAESRTLCPRVANPDPALVADRPTQRAFSDERTRHVSVGEKTRQA